MMCYGKWRWQNHKRIIKAYRAMNGKGQEIKGSAAE